MDAGGGSGELARTLTRAWPDEVAVVGLVARAADGPRPCEAAARLADASAADRRTLLANLAGGEPDLDGRLGVVVEEGLQAAGRSGRTLRDVARRPDGRRFLYLPAGRARGRDEGDGDASKARLVALMGRVAERVRRRGGRLLLFLREEESWPDALTRLMDGVVLLDRAALPAWEGGVPRVLGRLPGPSGRRGRADAGPRASGAATGPEREPGERSAPGDEQAEPRSWRRHRRSAGLPWTRIAAGVAAIVVLAGGWWWLARRTLPADGGGGEGAARPAGADTAPAVDIAAGAEVDTTGAGGDTAGATAGSTGPADGVPDPLRSSPELPYSVLIASYAEWSQARRRLDEWRDPSGPVYYVAPTRLRGGLYWRLFAGALADRASGEALMERLVEQGRKNRVRAWDVRPVDLAFLTGTEDSRAAADERVVRLEGQGVPGYVLPAAADGDTVWAVYAGGFESSEEAAELRGLLREAEIEAELVTRRGERDRR